MGPLAYSKNKVDSSCRSDASCWSDTQLVLPVATQQQIITSLTRRMASEMPTMSMPKGVAQNLPSCSMHGPSCGIESMRICLQHRSGPCRNAHACEALVSLSMTCSSSMMAARNTGI